MRNVFGKLNKKHFFVLYFVVLLIFSFFSLQWALSALIHKRKEVVVPTLIGKDIVAVLDIVSKLNLGIRKIGETYNPDYPEGTVVIQKPVGGSVVRERAIIEVILSLGGEKSFVPNLRNLHLRSAEIEIRKSGFKIGEIIYVFSSTVKENVVISQSPEPETILPKDSNINLVVSKGPPPEGITLAPDLIGKDIEEAIKIAMSKNIRYSVTELDAPQYASGVVVRQEPQPDTIIDQDTLLKLYVAKHAYEKDFEVMRYTLPSGGRDMDVKIVYVDGLGEDTLYSAREKAGSEIKFRVKKRSKGAKLRFFINGVLVEEREL